LRSTRPSKARRRPAEKRAEKRPRDRERGGSYRRWPQIPRFSRPSTARYSGGFFGRIGGTGETPVNPFAAGGSFDLSLPRFDESANSSPNTTRPFDGRFFKAVGQSVAAGCCAAGTPSSQMRHIPLGGRASAGIGADLPFCALSLGDPCCAETGATAALKNPVTNNALNKRITYLPSATRTSGANPTRGRPSAIEKIRPGSRKTNDCKHLEETLYTYLVRRCLCRRNGVSVG